MTSFFKGIIKSFWYWSRAELALRKKDDENHKNNVHDNISPPKRNLLNEKIKLTSNYIIHFILNIQMKISERERGHWAVYYISPQSFIIMFSFLLA